MRQSVKLVVPFLAIGLVLASPAEAMWRKLRQALGSDAGTLVAAALGNDKAQEKFTKQVSDAVHKQAGSVVEVLNRGKIVAAQARLDDLEEKVSALTGTAAPACGGAGEPPAEDLSDGRLASIEARIEALTATLQALASRPAAAAPPAHEDKKGGAASTAAASTTKDDGFDPAELEAAIAASLATTDGDTIFKTDTEQATRKALFENFSGDLGTFKAPTAEGAVDDPVNPTSLRSAASAQSTLTDPISTAPTLTCPSTPTLPQETYPYGGML